MEITTNFTALTDQVTLSVNAARQKRHKQFEQDITNAKNVSMELSQKMQEIGKAGKDYGFLNWQKGLLDYAIDATNKNIDSDNQPDLSVDLLHGMIIDAKNAIEYSCK